MTRTAAHLAICAILGCLTSIAVAWGFALRGGVASAPSRLVVAALPDTQDCNHITRAAHSCGYVEIEQQRWFSPRTDIEIVRASPWLCHGPPEEGLRRREFQFGYPRLCMWGYVDTEDVFCATSSSGIPPSSRNVRCVWRSSAGSLSQQTRDARSFDRDAREGNLYVPTGILWTGLATNTACYATAWWLILLAPAQLRTFIRKRRGQCMRCAYDLRSTPAGSPCPECGSIIA